ncbi:MAG: GNAT family N-acetyltransferase, partial [Planctomycetota bacterium]
RHAFHGCTPPFEVLEAHAHRANPASMRVLEACGFIEVGAMESRSAATGEVHASAVFELRRA